jgi:hypothetical protein
MWGEWNANVHLALEFSIDGLAALQDSVQARWPKPSKQ